ncbi:MAG: hypothetical protein Q9217_004553, partial [Psora testacea]
ADLEHVTGGARAVDKLWDDMLRLDILAADDNDYYDGECYSGEGEGEGEWEWEPMSESESVSVYHLDADMMFQIGSGVHDDDDDAETFFQESKLKSEVSQLGEFALALPPPPRPQGQGQGQGHFLDEAEALTESLARDLPVHGSLGECPGDGFQVCRTRHLGGEEEVVVLEWLGCLAWELGVLADEIGGLVKVFEARVD